MADINTYALGLEFQLLAQPAIDAVNNLVDSASKLQTSLTKAGKALNTSQNVEMLEWNREAQQALEMRITASMDTEEQYKRVLAESGMAEAMSAKAAEAHTEKVKEYRKQMLLAKDALQEFIDEHDPAFFKDELKDMTKREKGLKIFEEQTKENTETLQKQLKPVKELGAWFGNLSSEAGQLVQVVTKLTGAYGAQGAVLFLIGNSIKNLMTIQDAYAKSTFKLIGSQKQFIDTTIRLKTTLGLSTKAALSSVQAIAKVGFSASKEGAKGIEALTEANAKFNIATGVSTETTARFQRELGVLLGSNEEATQQLGELSQAMRMSGLSAEQAETLMSDLSKQMRTLAFDMNPKFATDYAKELVKLSAVFNRTGGSAEAAASQFNEIFATTQSRLAGFAKVGAAFDATASAAQNMDNYLEGAAKLVKQFAGNNEISTPIIMKALGVNEEFAESLRRAMVEADAAGKSMKEFRAGMTAGADLTRDAAEAQATLSQKLGILWHKFEAIWDKVSKYVIPVLEFLIDTITYVVDKVIAFHDWLEELSPTLTGVIDIALLAGITIIGLGTAIGGLGKIFGFLRTAVLGISAPMTAANTAMQASKAASLGAGTGVRAFLTNLGEGLKALGTPQAMKGAVTLGILTIAVAGTLLLVAYAMAKFGISGKDMILGATAMVIAAGAMVIMSFAIKALSNAGPKAALAGAIIIGVLLALGAATLMAGFGIGFMAKGFAELFKAIPDITTFVVVIAGMVLAMPLLAVGIAILGLSMMASAPLILAGFILMAAAAAIAYFVIPAFEDFAKSMMTISTALAGIGPDAGLRLLGLAAGITAFMAALLGIAAGGAVGGLGKIFGVKSPLEQAGEIAGAMNLLAAPASLLASSLDKIGKVGDIFKPFIDSTIGRKEELMAAVAMVTLIAGQVAAARKMMGEGAVAPFAPIVFKAEPVKKPLITEDTARKIRDERNQSLMVEHTKNTNESIKKVADKLDQETLKELVAFLKEWLPKLASGDKDSGGLASATNQWM